MLLECLLTLLVSLTSRTRLGDALLLKGQGLVGEETTEAHAEVTDKPKKPNCRCAWSFCTKNADALKSCVEMEILAWTKGMCEGKWPLTPALVMAAKWASL